MNFSYLHALWLFLNVVYFKNFCSFFKVFICRRIQYMVHAEKCMIMYAEKIETYTKPFSIGKLCLLTPRSEKHEKALMLINSVGKVKCNLAFPS